MNRGCHHVLSFLLMSFTALGTSAYAMNQASSTAFLFQAQPHSSNEIPLTLNSEGSEHLSTLKNLGLHDIVNDLMRLNYFTSSALIVSLPGLDKDVIFKWGFAGAGNIMLPFEGVTAQARTRLPLLNSNAINTPAHDQSMLLLKEVLYRFFKKIFTEKWGLKIESIKLSPLQVFSLKIVLLAKGYLEKQIPMDMVQHEVMRLMLRLSMTDEFCLTEKVASFGDYFAQSMSSEFVQGLEDLCPGLLTTIEQVWEALTYDVADTDFSRECGLTMRGIAFKDPARAREAFNVLKPYENEFPEANEKGRALIFQGFEGYQLVPYKDLVYQWTGPFTDFVSDITIDGVAHGNAWLQELFDDSVLVRLWQCFNKTMPVLVCEQDKKGNTWLLHFSRELSVHQAFGRIISCCVRALRQHAQAKRAFLLSGTPVAQIYQQKMLEEQKDKATLDEFFRSPQGMVIHSRLQEKIDAIRTALPEQTEQRAQALAQQIREKKEALVDINSKLGLGRQELANWKKLLQNNDQLKEHGVCAKLAHMVEQLTAEADALTTQITNLEQQQQALILTADTTLEDKKQSLSELIAFANDEYRLKGDLIPTSLEQEIQRIQQEISHLTTGEPGNLTPRERLSRREAIVQVYMTEAKQLDDYLEQEAKKRNNSVIEELKASKREAGYRLCIKHLKNYASCLQEENELARQLLAYREALIAVKASDISDEKKQAIEKLERRVGHVLDYGEQALLMHFFEQYDDIRAFFSDCDGHVVASSIIQNNVLHTLKYIAKHTPHLHEYLIWYRQAIWRILPELLPMFDRFVADL